MCSLDVDSDGHGVVTRIKAARKARWCATCHRALPIGGGYVRVTWIGDGRATDEASCSECWADNKEFSAAHGYAWLTPGLFAEQLACCVELVWDEDEDEEVETTTGEWAEMHARVEARRAKGTP